MEKFKRYQQTRFSVEILKEAEAALFQDVEAKDRKLIRTLSVGKADATWDHDNEEEFFADYRESHGSATFRIAQYLGTHRRLLVDYSAYGKSTEVRVGAEKRDIIEKIFVTFEAHLEESRLPEAEPTPVLPPPAPTIFIGHGNSPLWKDLKDHLHEKHGYDVTAYEIGARAGHTVRDILQAMLSKSSFAILVMTGEDEMGDGKLRPRQNVVHEAGLFQGRLGFNRAVVLLEEGTESFSNIDGIDQIRFSKENIKETFGEVVATLRREFG